MLKEAGSCRMVVVSCQFSAERGVVRVFKDADDLKDSSDSPVRVPASFHSPLQRLVNQFVARGCRGAWKGARNARAVLPEGHHLSLAVVLSVAKPTESGVAKDVSRQGIINLASR